MFTTGSATYLSVFLGTDTSPIYQLSVNTTYSKHDPALPQKLDISNDFNSGFSSPYDVLIVVGCVLALRQSCHKFRQMHVVPKIALIE